MNITPHSMRYLLNIIFLFLITILLIQCSENDPSDPSECMLTHFKHFSEIYNDSTIGYTDVLSYDQQGRVVKRTYYKPRSNGQRSNHYDSIAYEGNKVAGIYRILYYDDPTIIMAWEVEYADQYEVILHYFPLISESEPFGEEFVWRDDQHRIVKTKSVYRSKDKNSSDTFSHYYYYTYEDGNLIKRNYLYYHLSQGDTVNMSQLQEEWSGYSQVKNPFRELPFEDLRHLAYSYNIPTQYYQEQMSSGNPGTVHTSSSQIAHSANEFGYPDKFLYECK